MNALLNPRTAVNCFENCADFIAISPTPGAMQLKLSSGGSDENKCWNYRKRTKTKHRLETKLVIRPWFMVNPPKFKLATFAFQSVILNIFF
jgi:hypothetical protein